MAIALVLSLLSLDGALSEGKLRWAICYSDEVPIQKLDQYDLLVLDSDSHPPLSQLVSREKALLGYVSLGEVEDHRSFFSSVRSEGILLKENPNWKGSYFVDVRDGRWPARLLEQIIPSILKQGFNGLFLDTLDNAADLERSQPERYKGMRLAAAALVTKIRQVFPKTKIMMNRGYDLLPEVRGKIDFLLGESVFTTYDFKTRAYREVPPKDYLAHVQILKEAMERQPGLRVFTLDYWNPENSAELRRIYKTERSNGFEPYVSTIELNRIIAEPKP